MSPLSFFLFTQISLSLSNKNPKYCQNFYFLIRFFFLMDSTFLFFKLWHIIPKPKGKHLPLKLFIFPFLNCYCLAKTSKQFLYFLFAFGLFFRLFYHKILIMDNTPSLSLWVQRHLLPHGIIDNKILHGKPICKMWGDMSQNIIFRMDLCK